MYEISLICQDMSSIEVFIVPEAMKNDTATLEALGFTLNRNLNKYFYVQSGTGMLIPFFALEKLFLTALNRFLYFYFHDFKKGWAFENS